MSQTFDIKTKNGKAWFIVAEGIVKHQDTLVWNETTLHSSGGGGYVGPHGGHVDAPQIHSTNIEHQQHSFWITEPDGKEVSIELRNTSFRAAPGQKVRIGWGSAAGVQSGQYLFAHNFNSGLTTEFISNWWSWGVGCGLLKYPLHTEF